MVNDIGANVSNIKDIFAAILADNLAETLKVLDAYDAIDDDINAIDKHGKNVLAYAVEKRWGEVVEKLMPLGADANHRNLDGWTSLEWAIVHAYGFGGVVRNLDDIVQTILGSPHFIFTKNTVCALIHALRLEQSVIALVLLEAHVISFPFAISLDATDEAGNTALHYAVAQGYSEVVNALIAHGADVYKCNAQGQTPLQLAKGKFEIISILQPHYSPGFFGAMLAYWHHRFSPERPQLPIITLDTKNSIN